MTACVYMVAGAGEGRKASRMTPRLLEDGGATTEMGRRKRSSPNRGCVMEQEFRVGCFKFATPVSHPGEMPGHDVSASWTEMGFYSSLADSIHPKAGTVWTLDKRLLRGMTSKDINRPSLNHQRAAPSKKPACPNPETGPGQGLNTNLLPARASRSHFPGPRNE